ncbi:HD domain-containing protein [Candidatus Pacearchaeota archaeon]|nr:HD domain-containing protein [Candidatus Pacearchaeota archaeon]
MTTNNVFYDRRNNIEYDIERLRKNIVRRLIKEYPYLNENESYGNLFINLLSGRNKFPQSYKESILNKVSEVITMIKEEERVRRVRDEVYKLFKENAKNDYQKADWIFPNHFDIMVDLCKDMCKKYGGDVVVCELASYLHDAGLVVGRTTNSIEGHESRSAEYAKEVLKKGEFSQRVIDQVVECILITDKKEVDRPKLLNADIVRTADILSQFISIHYFAKASFFNNWEFFYKWLKDRVESCYKKIYFEEEKMVAKPIRDYLLKAIELYERHRNSYPSIFSNEQNNAKEKTNNPKKS